MAKNVVRSCPKCKGDLEMMLPDRERKAAVSAINGRCVKYGHRLHWFVFVRNLPPRSRRPGFLGDCPSVHRGLRSSEAGVVAQRGTYINLGERGSGVIQRWRSQATARLKL
jgi:hypothetical protein